MTNQVLSAAVQRSKRTTQIVSWFDLVSLCVIALAAGSVALPNIGTSYDDAYITYRYAYNFATGQGFVYNPGEWFMGTTAPLYGLLLGVLGISNPDAIPLISGLLSGLSLVLIGAALYLYGRLHGQPFCGLVAGLFAVTNPFVACNVWR